MYFLFNTSWSLSDFLGEIIGIYEWILLLDFLPIFFNKKLSLPIYVFLTVKYVISEKNRDVYVWTALLISCCRSVFLSLGSPGLPGSSKIVGEIMKLRKVEIQKKRKEIWILKDTHLPGLRLHGLTRFLGAGPLSVSSFLTWIYSLSLSLPKDL